MYAPRILTMLVVLLFTLPGFPQAEKKHATAVSVSQTPKIDGVLDESAWNLAAPAKDFIQRMPYNGKPATYDAEVRFLYDNTGLYVGAQMFDPAPDSIYTQLGLRDNLDLNADNFIVVISPFNDGINAFCFAVFASDVQGDFKLTGSDGDDDVSWDAVWTSKARINEKGWVVEMKIP